MSGQDWRVRFVRQQTTSVGGGLLRRARGRLPSQHRSESCGEELGDTFSSKVLPSSSSSCIILLQYRFVPIKLDSPSVLKRKRLVSTV